MFRLCRVSNVVICLGCFMNSRSLCVLALVYRGAVHETDIVYFPLPTELRARTRA